jgi:hypothetical protein
MAGSIPARLKCVKRTREEPAEMASRDRLKKIEKELQRLQHLMDRDGFYVTVNKKIEALLEERDRLEVSR